METLIAYVAQDRRFQLAGKVSLRERTSGAALFADISGFTALTEALANSLGPRRGAEELSIHLNAVYESLIAEAERFGGSVVAFAGDAITCWFGGDDGSRAITAALSMQAAMDRFAEVRLPNGETRPLAVKTGVAHGTARRFIVGNPEIQTLDVMAGSTLDRMADAAAAAHPRETLVAEETARAMGARLELREWRTGNKAGARVAAVQSFTTLATPVPWPENPPLTESTLQPFLLRPVWDRLKAGQGEFLTELRPAVALFLHFEGIDYDRDDDAAERLDAYVRWVQSVVDGYGGFLLALGMGDKGSHLYCCFGAPVAFENNAWRAAAAAEELRSPPPFLGHFTSIRIGISSGTVRTGAYGSSNRRTYGVLADTVNLAARLMERAAPEQILVSGDLHHAIRTDFRWRALDAVKVKGKTETIPVFELVHAAGQTGTRLVERHYALPMVGRAAELRSLEEKMQAALGGRGQVVCISGEAGMGKSRLLAEAARVGRQHGFEAHIGQCQAHGTHASYLAWQNIWQGLFELRSEGSTSVKLPLLQEKLKQIDSALLPRLPLLGPVLNLSLPENDVTRPLEARLRKASLEALLMTCLREFARNHPLLIVIEDHHWIDSVSADFLELVARSLGPLKVLLLITERPPEPGTGRDPEFRKLPWFSELRLTSFTREESQQLTRLKLLQLFGFEGDPPGALVERLAQRSAGNPFYLEELLNYLKDQGIEFQNPQALEQWELPVSLQTLILSRIDRLTQTQQSLLKISSVIGRLFPEAVLWGAQAQPNREQFAGDLSGLCRTELISIDRPEPELVYVFKHIVTQEVAYDSLPHATRARLHNEIGLILERLHPESLDQQLDFLAFHFDRSENLEKKRHYLEKAGKAAKSRYANAAAISYFERALPLLEDRQKLDTLLEAGNVWALLGNWSKADACFDRALTVARSSRDVPSQARCEAEKGDLFRKQGLCAEAATWLQQARSLFESVGDSAGVGKVLHTEGTVAAMVGDYEKAEAAYRQSLALREKLGEKAAIGSLLSNLGILARYRGAAAEARRLMEESLSIRRDTGDRWAIGNSLNNLGVVLREMDEREAARQTLEESLALNRQVGDPWATANTLCSLAELAADECAWESAQASLEESLRINIDLADRITIAYILECFARVACGQGQPSKALMLASAASALRTTLNSPLSPAESERLDHYLEPARRALNPAEQNAANVQGHAMPFDQAVALALA